MKDIDKIEQLSVVMAHQLTDYDVGIAVMALLLAAVSLEATDGPVDMKPSDAADIVSMRLGKLKAALK